MQQLIPPSKPAPCHKYSGTWSNVVLNEAQFGFTESGFFPVVLRHYLLQSPVGFCIILCLVVLVVVHESTHRP